MKTSYDEKKWADFGRHLGLKTTHLHKGRKLLRQANLKAFLEMTETRMFARKQLRASATAGSVAPGV